MPSEPTTARPLACALCLTVVLLGALPACWVLVDLLLDPQGALHALSDLTLWSRLTRSLALASASAALMLSVAIPLAWVLVRTDLPLRTVLLSLAAFPLFLPPLVHVLAWFGLLGWHGHSAIVAVNAVSYMPLALLLAATAFERIPRGLLDAVRMDASYAQGVLWEWRRALPLALAGAGLAILLMISLDDAARMEGAGWWRRFVSIVLPIAAPTFVSAFCVAMCFSLRELESFIMLAAGHESLTFKLYANVVFARRADLAALALILTLVTYLPFLVYVCAGRRWLRVL